MIPLQQMAEAIGQICRRARMRGLQVALEFIPGTGLPDVSFAQKVIESCGESNCKITLDFWHLDRSGGTIQDIRHLPPGIIAGLQLCDRIPPAPGTPYIPMSGRDLPGEGQLPLHDLVRSALTNSPGISAEVEVFKEDLRALPPDVAAARIAATVRTWRAGLSGLKRRLGLPATRAVATGKKCDFSPSPAASAADTSLCLWVVTRRVSSLAVGLQPMDN